MAIRYLSGINVDSNTLFVDDSNNRVGIGTASPSSLLHVQGNVLFTGRLDFTNANVHVQRNGNELQLGAYSGWRFYDMQGSSVRMFLTQAGNLGVGTTSPSEKLHVAGNGLFTGGIYVNNTSAYLWNTTNGVIRFGTNNLERARIDASGNVGIGTTSPSQKLDVVGNILAQSSGYVHVRVDQTDSGMIDMGMTSGTAEGFLNVQNTGAGHVATPPEFKLLLNASEKMRVDENGDVGIGETNVDARLHITTASAGLVNQKFESAGSAAWRLGIPASQTYFAFDNSADALTSPKMVITSAGAVGIGTTAPSYTMDVVGDFRARDNSNQLVFAEHGTSDIAELKIIADTAHDAALYFGDAVDNVRAGFYYDVSANQLQFRGYDNGNRMVISSNGNVGIGTTSPNTKLSVSGNSGERIQIISTDTSLAADELVGAFEVYKTDGSINGAGVFGSLNVYSQDLGGSSYVTLNTSYSDGNNIERVRINAQGNVGIGTTSPADSLHVNGGGILNVGTTNTYAIHMNADSGSGPILTFGNSTDYDAYGAIKHGSSQFQFLSVNRDYNFLNNGSSLMLIDVSTGNVGINTTSPAASLHIEKTGDQASSVKGMVLSSGAAGTNKFLPSITWSYGASGTPDFARLEVQRGGGVSGRMLFSVANSSGTMTEAMRIDDAARLGIGTTTPTTRLDLGAGNGAAYGLSFGSSSTGVHRSLDGTTLDMGHWANVAVIIDTDNNDSSRHFSVMANSNDSTTATTLMRVLETGSVGIGTTSPTSSKLNVNSNGSSDSVIRIDGANARGASRYALQIVDSDTNSRGSVYVSTTSGPSAMFIGGNVGIGTTSPARKLQVGDGSADDRIRVYFSDGTYSEQTGYGMEFARAASYLRPTGNANKIMYFGAVANNWNGLYSYSASGFFWNNASTEHMRLSSAGNLGINTTSPSYKLDVNGSFRGGGFIADDSTFTLTFNSVNVLYGNLSYGALPAAATFGTGDSGIVSDFPGSEVMRIASLGRVGINTTSPQANLHLNGSLRVDAPTNFANIAAGLRADPGNGIIGNDPDGLGQDQHILGTPDTWLAVNINGTDYAIPAYAP